MFARPIQHCAMPNKTNIIHSCILQHMVPLYMTPFGDISGNGFQEVNDNIRKMLGIDNPQVDKVNKEKVRKTEILVIKLFVKSAAIFV